MRKSLYDFCIENEDKKYLLDEWDYDKNEKSPKEFTYGSNKKVWWVCNKGHSYNSMINNRVKGRGCPICAKEKHTSFPEQAFYYYISKYCPSALSNDKKILNNKLFELDIFIPEKNIAIEYDGVNWHKSKQAIDRDNRKDLICKNIGITLIRIRENGLCTLKNSINIFREDNYSDNSLEKVINEVLLKLNVVNISVNIEKDRQSIYSMYIKMEKEKSVAAKFPEIAKEWHPTLNGNLTADKVSYGTSKKFWWKCPNGHSYEASVAHRTFEKTGCPYCSSQKVLVGFNDLCTTNPELLKEWDYIKNIVKPEDVIKGSNKKYWWICKEGHSYSCTLNHRIYENSGCPYCSGRKVLKGFNDLQTKYPNVINEWDYNKNKFNPDEVTVNSNKKAWLVCEKGHSYKQKIQDHYGKNLGCPICSNKKVLKGYNDLATVYPQLLKYWDYKKNTIKPEEISSGSQLKVWWLCHEGHSFKQTVYSHIKSCKKNNSGCPICRGLKVLQGFNDLCTTHPELAKEWDYNKNKLSPTKVSKGSSKKIWWICSEGHSYLASVANRTKGKGCPYCSGQKVLKGFNDFATVYPELLKEWDFSKNIKKPTEVTRCGGGKFYWLCKNGHSYQSTISHRIDGTNCPYCGGQKVLEGFNDVATVLPEILEYWDYDKNIIKPTEISKGSQKKVYFIKDGKSYNTTINNFIRYI